MKLLCNTLTEHDRLKEGKKNRENDNNFVNESHLFTQGKIIVKTYTTTAQEPYIYSKIIKVRKKLLAKFKPGRCIVILNHDNHCKCFPKNKIQTHVLSPLPIKTKYTVKIRITGL